MDKPLALTTLGCGFTRLLDDILSCCTDHPHMNLAVSGMLKQTHIERQNVDLKWINTSICQTKDPPSCNIHQGLSVLMDSVSLLATCIRKHSKRSCGMWI